MDREFFNGIGIFDTICNSLDIVESYRVALCSKLLLSLWEKEILYKNIVNISRVIEHRAWSILQRYPYYIKNDIPYLSVIACEKGYIAVLEWMLYMNKRITHCAIDIAAKNGQIDTVLWLQINKPCAFTKRAIELAAENNHFAVVKHLHNTTFTNIQAQSVDAACKSGNLALVKWLVLMRPEECTGNANDNAAAAGSIEILEYLYANRIERCTSSAVEEAAFNGHYDTVNWLLEHGVTCNYLLALVCSCESNNYNIAKLIRHYMLSTRHLL